MVSWGQKQQMKRRKNMIYTPVARAKKYDYLAGRFAKVYDFLAQENLAGLAVGTLSIQGDEIYALIQTYQTIPAEQCKIETHDRYIDVQFIVSGQERMGVVARDGLTAKAPYDPAKDCTFYEEPAEIGSLVMNAGDLVILTPEEAHKPKCICGEAQAVKKIVVKIKV
jgi:biofilm protein TabA